MEGLEISEIKFSILKKIQTHRIDAEYYQKRNIEIESFIRKKKNKFSTLNDYNLKVDGSAFYPSIEHFYGQGYLPFLRVGDVYGKINYDSCVCIPLSLTNRYKTLKIVEKGDLVLTKGGSVARIGMVREKAAVSRDLIFINSSLLSAVESNYLYLYFQTKFANRLLIQSSSQSVQPHLTITLVREIPIFNVHIEIKKILLQMVNKSYQHEIQHKTLYQQAEDILLEELELTNFIPTQQAVNIKSIKESFEATGRLDAEYYQPKYEEIETILSKKQTDTIEKICSYINYGTVPTSPYIQSSISVPYIKGMNLNNLEVTNNLDHIENVGSLSDKYFTKEGDIIISQMGTVGNVGVITSQQEGFTFASFTIRIRIRDKTKYCPYYVGLYIQNIAKEWYLLRNIAQASVRQNTDLPTIKNMRIPYIAFKKQQEISVLIQQSFALKAQSEQLLSIAKQAVEMAIEYDEETAIQFIKENTDNITFKNNT
ncbi:restriction endonuclease subunit S domain-containing protein [Commensalibacter oyaizuii]|uniref:Type I restriction modification DNA specificity domain-containing protein n=1 Tax=Commensalibacter oyaizuii TaxID=3043873 RepID=A0ABT6PYG7_9PROT|nr:hypothetical protein [Commensalibacter sp. TBRC 16381]MDI2089893.1 hypothetical protein [Commensalibacter sp. TBRC 16381]